MGEEGCDGEEEHDGLRPIYNHYFVEKVITTEKEESGIHKWDVIFIC